MAKFEFFLQPVCSRAETLYLSGLLGRQAELGVCGGGELGGESAVKVEEIDRLRGEEGDRRQVLAEGNWEKKKVHLLTLPGWRESWRRQFISLKETLKNFFFLPPMSIAILFPIYMYLLC